MASTSPPSQGAVLLTGGTGQVGAHLLVDLLRAGRDVVALVRGDTKQHAFERIDRQLELFEQTTGETFRRPLVVAGDINLPNLGLDALEAVDVRRAISTVVHSAASLSFRPASENEHNEPFRTNVDGLKNLLAFGRAAGVQDWHIVSTAFVCGMRDGFVAESDCDLGQEVANDYERSKILAEQIVASEIPADQLSIYRPSIVVDTAVPFSSNDRTVYHVLDLYTRLTKVIPRPNPGELPSLLMLSGDERKNLVEASWVSKVIVAGVQNSDFLGRTYHLTSADGVRIGDLDAAFLNVVSQKFGWPSAESWNGPKLTNLDGIASTFLSTFAPYFRSDPQFDRRNTEDLLAASGVSDHYDWQTERAVRFASHQLGSDAATPAVSEEPQVTQQATSTGDGDSRLVIVGMWAAVPGGDGLEAFESLLADGRAGYAELPPERFETELYFDDEEGVAGKTYTTLGGIVPERPLNRDVCPLSANAEELYDASHLRFCETAAHAWRHAGLKPNDSRMGRTGVFVGHSGGTKRGGPLSLTTTIERFAADLATSSALSGLPTSVRNGLIQSLVRNCRQDRPRRNGDNPRYDAFMAAASTAETLGLGGPCHVVDAACASSLVALDQAAMAIESGQCDAAIVGGSTYNGVDNLILFSHSRACSRGPSRPFDRRAEGLVSSEGYVALVVTTGSRAAELGLTVLAEIGGVGTSSDGRGKSLWAPREEGQQLALRRAYAGQRPVLDVDTLECHATSTALGDATELKAVAAVSERQGGVLPISSAKSNLGHTLEAAGLIGLVKTILAMRRGERFPSVGFEQPSETVDWNTTPVRVVTKREPWQPREDARTGAVSAFGIGGLNAHVWIRQSKTGQLQSTQTRSVTNEPIAVVGRGIVLPGANTVEQLGKLFESGQTAIGDAPQSRWRGLTAASCGLPTNRGGYIESFAFDATHYRVLPLQVKRANPAQFMLLEAVAQAAREAGADPKIGHPGVPWPVDSQRTAVVVGSIFGGEFSNELQLGLRLPELRRDLVASLNQSGVGNAEQIADECVREALELYPALLDETGSFTASTLASRIAKTFDLMGGAAAVDSGDGSGLAALCDAIVKLRTGRADTVVCAVVQRAMDLPAYERLAQLGRLVESGNPADIPDDCSQILPGEGVAAIVLRRLSDAQADGQTVHTIIHDLEVDRTPAAMTVEDANVVRTVGFLAGAHPVVRLIVESEAGQNSHSTLASTDATGATRRLSVEFPGREPVAATRVAEPAKQFTPATPALSMSQTNGLSTSGRDFNPSDLKRYEASTAADFSSLLDALACGQSRAGVASFSGANGYRLAVCSNDVAAAAKALKNQIARGASAGADVKTLAVFSTPSNSAKPARTAWLFPGQGSLPAAWPADTAINQELSAGLNSALAAERQAAIDFSSLPNQPIAGDLWSSQMATLIWSAAHSRQMSDAGLRADVVVGHSFGECAAAWTAQALDLASTVRLSRLRADLITAAAGTGGGLLSVRGTPPEVQQALANAGLQSSISHHNAPQQTVVSVVPGEMDEVKSAIRDAGLAQVPLPVSVPFHSRYLAEAERHLEALFPPSVCSPPVTGFLSATQLRYVAEPADIHRSLVGQLTQPVLFAQAMTRLINDGVKLFVECGPGSVLSRLTAEVSDANAIIIPLDDAADARLPLVQAACECLGIGVSHGSVSRSNVTVSHPHVQTTTPSAAAPSEDVDFIDVTKSRRPKTAAQPAVASPSRLSPPASPTPTATNGVHHRLPEPTTPEVEESSSTGGVNHDDALSFLIDLTIELTGYSRDVIDPTADLEADLGVDSIKKAQLIGELAEWSGWTERPAGLKLEDVKTLDAIAGLAARHAGGGSASAGSAPSMPAPGSNGHASSNGNGHPHTPPAPTSVTGSNSRNGQGGSATVTAAEPANIATHAAPASTTASLQSAAATAVAAPEEIVVSSSELEAMLIDMLVVQTGYAPDVIDLDADLEADLGVDSIKHAQLIGELYAHFNLTAEVQRGTGQPIRSLSEFRTLRAIENHLLERLGQSGKSAAPAPGMDAPQKQNGHAVPSPATGATVSNPPSTGAPAVQLPSLPFPGTTEKQHTKRFALRIVPAPQRERMPDLPNLSGPALIVGQSDVATELANAVERLGQRATIISAGNLADAEQALTQLWQSGATPHLFLCTAADDGTISCVDPGYWKSRRVPALTVPYRICQLWYEHTIEAGLMDNATVVAVTALGGDFGFGSSGSVPHIASPEGGGLGGLVKAMLIEAWMRGFRSTPMKVVDVAPGADPQSVAGFVLKELAVPSYDMEVAYDGQQRLAVQAFPKPLAAKQSPRRPITRGGTWVVAGGGRGITPACAMELAVRHDLTLALLGTAPVPTISESIVAEYDADRSALRRRIVREATDSGVNSLDAWRDLEKAVEIIKTLEACRAAGVQADYFSCDVSDADSVRMTLNDVRQRFGPIRGVLQGAGAGQDSRFDRKQPDKVDKCLKAKIDGALALAAATFDDPLEWFVGFGSISGRFGANGHTDYSLANDMLAKCVGLVRQTRDGSDGRPPVAACTFHWHAWDDIGMATKPEAKLALEMIDMEFMPAVDGIAHFLRELEHGGEESEILITDENYFRKFFPADRISNDSPSEQSGQPLLGETGSVNGIISWTLDPVRDRFLAEHCVRQRPTLPFVVAIEAMAEAALRESGDHRVVSISDVAAEQALKFATDDCIAATLPVAATEDAHLWRASLCADVRRRDGRLITENREYFHGNVETSNSPFDIEAFTAANAPEIPDFANLHFHGVQYLEADAPVYHGEPLRTLRTFAITGNELIGRLAGPAQVELFGESRGAHGWIWGPAAADGCLYAVAVLAHSISGRPSLPVRFGRIQFGRAGDPGEPLTVKVTLQSQATDGAIFNWSLIGANGDLLIHVTDYQVAWLS